MANWLQSQFKVAEGLLEAVDRTAKHASKKELLEESRSSLNMASERHSTSGMEQTLMQKHQADKFIEM